MDPNAADEWFTDRIISGVQSMVTLHLPGGPPADTVAYTAQVWVASLWGARRWQQEPDADRIDAAFQRLLSSCDRWPAPARLLDLLPARQPERELPPPPISEQRRRENIVRLRAIIADLLRRG